MYLKPQDTQQYILNNRFIIAKVAIKEKKKNNQISTKIYVRNYYARRVWITFRKIEKKFLVIHNQIEQTKEWN